MIDRSGWTVEGRVLVDGDARGEVLLLEEPLSFWGGLDPADGCVIDRRHPQRGARLAGRVLAMRTGRGSSSSSSVLAEALRAGTGPAAVLLREADQIVVIGSLVAGELYGRSCPVLVLAPDAYAALSDGARVRVDPGGRVSVEAEP